MGSPMLPLDEQAVLVWMNLYIQSFVDVVLLHSALHGCEKHDRLMVI